MTVLLRAAWGLPGWAALSLGTGDPYLTSLGTQGTGETSQPTMPHESPHLQLGTPSPDSSLSQEFLPECPRSAGSPVGCDSRYEASRPLAVTRKQAGRADRHWLQPEGPSRRGHCAQAVSLQASLGCLEE